jgi:hypothetical protein
MRDSSDLAHYLCANGHAVLIPESGRTLRLDPDCGSCLPRGASSRRAVISRHPQVGMQDQRARG